MKLDAWCDLVFFTVVDTVLGCTIPVEQMVSALFLDREIAMSTVYVFLTQKVMELISDCPS